MGRQASTTRNFEHSHFHDSLMWGENLTNLSITGTGRIYGKGLARGWEKEVTPQYEGNKAIALKNCRNVLLRDFTILHGGWFAILATGVDNLVMDAVKLDTQRDGMDIDCCHNVRVSDCSVNSPWDDGICLKSSFGLGQFRSTENVTITNCLVSGYDEGTMLDGTRKHEDPSNPEPTGRIKFGTESNGGFQAITISNCIFECCQGLAMESDDGALVEDVHRHQHRHAEGSSRRRSSCRSATGCAAPRARPRGQAPPRAHQQHRRRGRRARPGHPGHRAERPRHRGRDA